MYVVFVSMIQLFIVFIYVFYMVFILCLCIWCLYCVYVFVLCLCIQFHCISVIDQHVLAYVLICCLFEFVWYLRFTFVCRLRQSHGLHRCGCQASDTQSKKAQFWLCLEAACARRQIQHFLSWTKIHQRILIFELLSKPNHQFCQT